MRERVVLIAHDRSPHEHALAVLLEGRAPVVAVRRLEESPPSRWQEHPNFGQRSRRESPGGSQPGRPRQRQFQAFLGQDQVTISSDADERPDPRLGRLLAAISDAYRV